MAVDADIHARGEPLDERVQDKLDRQIAAWRDRLLALDRRQRLLYFKHLKTGSLEFEHVSPLDTLAILDTSAVPVRATESDTRRSKRALYVNNKSEETLQTSLRRIEQRSNQEFADRGVWTLYLGVLMLRWIDSSSGDGGHIDSPLILVPVRVDRAGANNEYVLARTEDDITVNPALKLKLEEHRISLPDIDPDDLPMQKFSRGVEAAIAEQRGWSIEQRMVLGNFTFQKEAMYQDLVLNREAISSHDMVRLLALGPDSPSSTTFAFERMPLDGLDDVYHPESMFSILDADSSQRRCILSAADGKSFVMDGPPGTGKSQTIANMIAELMARGKTVLFVSEKAAALDVVRDRLASAYLRHYLFELHSHSATRREVAAELSRTLHRRAKTQTTFSAQKSKQLALARRQLTDFAEAMNEVDQRLDRSVFDVLGRLTELDVRLEVPLRAGRRWAKLSDSELDDIKRHATNLGLVWQAVKNGHDCLWRDLAADDLDAADARDLRYRAIKAMESAQQLAQCAVTVAFELGIPVATDHSGLDAQRRILAVLDSRPAGVPIWYDAPDLSVIQRRAVEAKSVVTQIVDRSAELERLAGPRWRELDVQHRRAVDVALANPMIDIDHDAGTLLGTAKVMNNLVDVATRAIADADELGRLLGVPTSGLTTRRAAEIACLALLAAAPARPDITWLNGAELARIDGSIDVLDESVRQAMARRAAVEHTFNPEALGLDLSTLNIRFQEVHRGLRRWGSAARQDKKAIKSVAVSGRCDKSVVGKLGEAVSWQRAVGEMADAEESHGSDLGPRYKGPATDFDELRSALKTTRQVLDLAGADVDLTTLGSQLSFQGVPDPRLVPVAERLLTAIQQFDETVAGLGQRASQDFANARLETSLARSKVTGTAAAELSAIVYGTSTVTGRNVTVREVRTLLSDIGEILDLETKLASRADFDIRVFGHQLTVTSDFDAIEQGLLHSRELKAVVPVFITEEIASRLVATTSSEADLVALNDLWADSSASLLSAFTEERQRDFENNFESGLDIAIELLEDLSETAVAQIEPWCTAHRELTWADEQSLSPVVSELLKTPTTVEEIVSTIEFAVLEAWVESRVRSDPRLADHRTDTRDGIALAFRELDEALIRNTHARVIAECNERAPISTISRAAQLITREGEKKTRHKPVHVLLAETAGLVQQIKPCFMMSPLSVSQYLPQSIRFDVVIFDEASQVLPSDALNCVYRGKQLIVAGDQKQLPPTDFFNTGVDEVDLDEDTDASDFQSVLDLAKGAGGLVSLPLNWHYRSRHEDLISFSNHQFYDGDLMTFPGAVFDAPDLGVALFPVKGVYRRGSSRDNPVEAAKVVERLIWFRRNRPEASIGVVTFSSAQADQIVTEIESRSEDEPLLAGVLLERDRLDGFFVKSLENVQGDERDVILFSLGYGPDEDGRLTNHFGPLNKAGGWRRLNVAITRARKRIEIVTSFTANQMAPSENETLQYLRGYLDFAERGHRALVTVDAGKRESISSKFEDELAVKIRSWGHDVVQNVGVAGYRIDLGVRHPSRTGEYVIGIECDGAAYFSGQTARDRDRLRAQVLTGLGWKMHRVWALGWWRDRVGQETALRTAIDTAISQADSGRDESNIEPKEPLEVTFEDVADRVDRTWTVPYVAYSGRPAAIRDPKTMLGSAALTRYLAAVIRAEAPVHVEILADRFRSAWGLQRIGAQARRSLDQALAKAHSAGPDQAGFYWTAEEVSEVRVPGPAALVRKPLQVPIEEIELALLWLVEESVTQDEQSLVKYTAELFGWQRITAEVGDRLAVAIKGLVQNELLEVDTSGDLRLVYDAR